MNSLFPIVDNEFSVPDVFDNFFNRFMWPSEFTSTMPKVDIEDKGSEYVMTADLPGVQKEDIHLSYDNNVLTLAASHNEQKDSQDDQHNYICKERSSSSFCRQFPVTSIQKEGIQAAFKDGVLTITLPKDAPQAQPTNTIEIQ